MDESTKRTIILLLTLILPVLSAWFANGAKTDQATLCYLGVAFIAAILVFLQRSSEKQSLKKQYSAAKAI